MAEEYSTAILAEAMRKVENIQHLYEIGVRSTGSREYEFHDETGGLIPFREKIKELATDIAGLLAVNDITVRITVEHDKL